MSRFTLTMCVILAMAFTTVGCTDSAEPLPPKPQTPAPTAKKPAERKPDKPIMEGTPTIDDFAVRKKPEER